MSWSELERGHQGRNQQDHQFRGYTFSWPMQLDPVAMSAAQAVETCGHGDKCDGLVCSLSSLQGKRGVASIHSASWNSPWSTHSLGIAWK